MRAASRRADDGSIMPLVIGYALIGLLLLTVLVAASRVFLVQRSLSAAADGAATAAADSIDVLSYYSTTGDVTVLPLDEARVIRAVENYLEDAGVRDRFDDVQVQTTLSEDRTTVHVSLSAVVRLPLTSSVTREAAGGSGYRVAAAASARTPLQP